MLGVRLDTELEERLAAVARTQGRSKSDIAREAVRRYVDLHDDAYRREARRQSTRCARVEIRHGGIVLVDGPDGAPARPCVVVQSDLFNATHATITVCPLTSVIGGEALFRVVMSPREHNGLTAECEVEVDRITSVARDRITAVIGDASPTRMEQIDQALRRWLML
ncbi:hypothetical protein WR25_07284 [Diploscapter pachys]|uniref:Ribbon-helix-helix protein CopG domain-containing protein n=1 Tax=Diploscapter pachys TaxID=2018661 RepID=A0A2A2K280_9BILA|nr:hypothetical protein WR25_07284 [Diploscapter pachys]